jgi:hypothetical protein
MRRQCGSNATGACRNLSRFFSRFNNGLPGFGLRCGLRLARALPQSAVVGVNFMISGTKAAKWRLRD